MNLAEWSEADRAGLRRFYEADKRWSWSDIEDGLDPVARATADWIRASPPPQRYPVILPRVTGTGSNLETNWYAVAFSEAQAEELRDHLNAFVGRAGTDFNGLRAALVPADEAEAALADWSGGRWIYRFGVVPSKRGVVRNGLRRMQQTWRMRPNTAAAVFRTTEGLIREFFSALVNRDDAGAATWLGELRAGGRLSAENLVFLEIERLAAFDRWEDIAALPQLSLLMLMRRPRHITALLIEALWRAEMGRFADTGDVAGALERFRSDFYPRYQPLLRARGNLSSPPVVLSFLFAAVSAEPPRREQIPTLVALLAGTPQQSFATAVAAGVPGEFPTQSPVVDPVTAAIAAFRQDDYDGAWEHLQYAPRTVESCSLLLECAAELQSSHAAELVRERLADLAAESQQVVLASHRRRRAWEELQLLLGTATAALPSNWEQWFDQLDADPESPQLLRLAHEAAYTWSLTDYQIKPHRVRRLSERIIADRGEKADETLRYAFPHLVAFFLRGGLGVPEFLAIYRNLLLLLGVSERFSGEDWATSQTLLLAISDAGADGPTYAETAGTLREIWTRFGSASRLDWALDTLDLLAAHAAPDAQSRDRFFDAIRDSIAKDYRRVLPAQWQMFEYLASDLGREADFNALRPPQPSAEASTGAAIAEALRGKLVAIYTLTASAGARAKAIIESLFPGVDVRLTHDHGGSDRLKALARDADYFVVATRSAAHAATDFLKANRPRERSALIYPAGKGSSSIVFSLRAAIEAEFA